MKAALVAFLAAFAIVELAIAIIATRKGNHDTAAVAILNAVAVCAIVCLFIATCVALDVSMC